MKDSKLKYIKTVMKKKFYENLSINDLNKFELSPIEIDIINYSLEFIEPQTSSSYISIDKFFNNHFRSLYEEEILDCDRRTNLFIKQYLKYYFENNSDENLINFEDFINLPEKNIILEDKHILVEKQRRIIALMERDPNGYTNDINRFYYLNKLKKYNDNNNRINMLYNIRNKLSNVFDDDLFNCNDFC